MLFFIQLPLSLLCGFGLCRLGNGPICKSLPGGVVGGVIGSTEPGLSALPLSSVKPPSWPEAADEFETCVDSLVPEVRPIAVAMPDDCV